MARKQLDANGFPVRHAPASNGSLTIRPTKEAWAAMAELRVRWSKEHDVNLSLTDVVNAALIQTHNAVAVQIGMAQAFAPPPADPVDEELTPLEKAVEEVKKAKGKRRGK